MNKLSITLITVLAISTTTFAVAAPDFQNIEKARKARQLISATQVSNVSCATPQTSHFLDHGPRAQVTPAQNAKLKQQYEAAANSCK